MSKTPVFSGMSGFLVVSGLGHRWAVARSGQMGCTQCTQCTQCVMHEWGVAVSKNLACLVFLVSWFSGLGAQMGHSLA